MANFGKIGVLAGGPSNEREISLISGRAVYNALKESDTDVTFIDIVNIYSAKEQIEKAGIELAFIALHGRFGEDGTVQSMLEDMNIPYTGSGPAASRLAIDKIVSREIFLKNGLAVPRGKTLAKDSFDLSKVNSVYEEMGFPLVVKPQFEGSSIGISIAVDRDQLSDAINLAFNYGDNIIVEQYVKGRELTVGILAEEPLPVIEIVAAEKFYDFNAKYQSDSTKYVLPAPIRDGDYKQAQANGIRAHRLLGCRSFSRVDMILNEDQDKIFLLEVNSIPGFTSHSLLPKAAAHVGISFNQLCLKIVELAFLRKSGIKEKVTNRS